jgi:hypothetical protein
MKHKPWGVAMANIVMIGGVPPSHQCVGSKTRSAPCRDVHPISHKEAIEHIRPKSPTSIRTSGNGFGKRAERSRLRGSRYGSADLSPLAQDVTLELINCNLSSINNSPSCMKKSLCSSSLAGF